MDINLDEPLRDDEKLFVPKPYIRPEPVANLPSSSKPKSTIEHERPTKLENAVNGKAAKKKKREPKTEKEGEERATKPKKKAGKKAKKHKEEQPGSYTMLNSSPVENNVEKNEDNSLLSFSDSISTSYQPKGSSYKELVENDRVKIVNRATKNSKKDF